MISEIKINHDYKFCLGTFEIFEGIVLDKNDKLIKIRSSGMVRNGKVYYLNVNKLIWFREVWRVKIKKEMTVIPKDIAIEMYMFETGRRTLNELVLFVIAYMEKWEEWIWKTYKGLR